MVRTHDKAGDHRWCLSQGANCLVVEPAPIVFTTIQAQFRGGSPLIGRHQGAPQVVPIVDVFSRVSGMVGTTGYRTVSCAFSIVVIVPLLVGWGNPETQLRVSAVWFGSDINTTGCSLQSLHQSQSVGLVFRVSHVKVSPKVASPRLR